MYVSDVPGNAGATAVVAGATFFSSSVIVPAAAANGTATGAMTNVLASSTPANMLTSPRRPRVDADSFAVTTCLSTFTHSRHGPLCPLIDLYCSPNDMYFDAGGPQR